MKQWEIQEWDKLLHRAKLLEFVKMVARLMRDGEPLEDGSMFVMENDDAVATLHNLIDLARGLTRGNTDPSS